MRTCTKIMALLGLTATSQAARSFNTQISVSAQQERAAYLAQTSTAEPSELLTTLYEGTAELDTVLTALYESCEDADNETAAAALKWMDEGLDYICENVDCEAMAHAYGLDDDEMDHVCGIVEESCDWGEELDSWVYYLESGLVEWDDIDCHAYLEPFKQLEDDLMEALCWYFPCYDEEDMSEAEELLYNIAWGVSVADDLANAAYTACLNHDADVALVALWYLDYAMDYLCAEVTEDLVASLDVSEDQALHIYETVETACYLGALLDDVQEHIEEHGATWDADNCDDYIEPLWAVIDNVSEAVCWFLDCETHNAYLMLENLYWGMHYAEYVIDDAVEACESGDVGDALESLHLLNFGMDYICHNVTWDSMAIFLDDLTIDQVNHIYNTVVDACYLGEQLDDWIAHVDEYGIPAGFECVQEFEIFEDVADDILEALSWHFE